MQLGSKAKLMVICLAMVCLTVLLVVHAIDVAAGMSPITAMVFYVIGNGFASRSGVGVQSVIEPKAPTT